MQSKKQENVAHTRRKISLKKTVRNNELLVLASEGVWEGDGIPNQDHWNIQGSGQLIWRVSSSFWLHWWE